MSDVIDLMVDGWFDDGFCEPRLDDSDVLFRKRMGEALCAAEKAGWRLVPVEPTEEMLVDSAKAVRDFISERGEFPRTRAMWRKAIQAAPRPWDEVER